MKSYYFYLGFGLAIFLIFQLTDYHPIQTIKGLNSTITDGLYGYNRGDTSKLDVIIKQNSKDVDAYYMRSRIRSEYGNTEGAIEDLTKAIENSGDKLEGFPNLPAIYYSRGQEYRLLALKQNNKPEYQAELYQKSLADYQSAARILHKQKDFYRYNLTIRRIEWIKKSITSQE